MKSHLVIANLAILTIFASMSASTAMADSIIKQPQINDVNKTSIPNNIGAKLPVAVINGVITFGSNDGGSNFSCNKVKVYVAEDTALPPSPGSTPFPNYKPIGKTVTATPGNPKTCKYTLFIDDSSAIGKSLYVLGNYVSTEKWTKNFDVIDVYPDNFSNPIKVNKNDNLINKNLKVFATRIK